MEMSREGVAGGPGGPVPDRRWMEMSASISSTGYRVACTVSASYGQGLGEAGQISEIGDLLRSVACACLLSRGERLP